MSEFVSIYSGFREAEEQRRAIKQEITEERLRRSKEQINADDQMEHLTANQIAMSTVSGFDYSGSFANLTASNIDKFEEDSSIKKLSSDLKIDSLKAESKDTYANAWLNAFSQFSKGAEKAATLMITS